MDEPPPNNASPGFRSLAQAGIHLTEGETLPEGIGSIRSAEWIEAHNQNPEWPPLPTLTEQEQESRKTPTPTHPASRPSRVYLQPRGLSRAQTPGHPPVGRVIRTPPLQFSCPCCGTVLSVTNPASYRGQPGPCPFCKAVILPPQMVSPFTITELPDGDHGDF